MRLVFIWVVVLVSVIHAVSEPRSVIGEIHTALSKRDDSRRVNGYLQKSLEALNAELPLINKDGKGKSCYTFFAPTTSAFNRATPLDIADPFFVDDDFRKATILRHFARQCVSKEDLKTMKTIMMADSKSVEITLKDDVIMINDAEIVSEAIQLDDKTGVIFMVDRVFVTPDQVSAVIEKNPGPSIGLVPPRIARENLKGAYAPAEVDAEDVKEMAEFAAVQLAAESNSGPLKVIEITSAAKQVVAGINYKLVLKLVDAAKKDNSQTCEVVVTDQSWTKTRTLTSSDCNLATAKVARDTTKVESLVITTQAPTAIKLPELILGGYSAAEVDRDDIKKMANFAAQQLAAQSNSGPLKVIEITSAKTQVVSGTNYKLMLKLVDAEKNDSPQTCEVVIYDQPWTDTRKLSSSDCDPPAKTKLTKREDPPLEGGYSVASIDDDDVKEIASFATSQIASKINSAGPQKLVKIVSASTQVVAGRNFKLVLELIDEKSNENPKTCEVVVFDQAWTKTRELSEVNCNNPDGAKIDANPQVEQKPAATLPGGYQPISVTDSKVVSLSNWAAKQLAAKSNSKNPFKVIQIKSAGSQVVAGANYQITMVLAGPTGPLQTCTVVIFVDLTNTNSLTDSSCSKTAAQDEVADPEPEPEPEPSSRSTRQLNGAYEAANVDDSDVKEMAAFAALQLAANTNTGPVSVIKIDSAAKQVVAGSNYKIVLHLQKKDDQNAEPLVCQVIIFDQPWTSTRKLSESQCGPDVKLTTKVSSHTKQKS